MFCNFTWIAVGACHDASGRRRAATLSDIFFVCSVRAYTQGTIIARKAAEETPLILTAISTIWRRRSSPNCEKWCPRSPNSSKPSHACYASNAKRHTGALRERSVSRSARWDWLPPLLRPVERNNRYAVVTSGGLFPAPSLPSLRSVGSCFASTPEGALVGFYPVFTFLPSGVRRQRRRRQTN